MSKIAGMRWYIITLQVPVSGVYLMTTSIHCTTRNHVNSTAAEKNEKMIFVLCKSESNSSSLMTSVNMLAGLTLNRFNQRHQCALTIMLLQLLLLLI
jgi:hypothetical protein